MTLNDLDLKNWKELNINTDSLWLINERDKSGKHTNVYHGNFIPQIPNQLIRRYTKNGETVLDSFLGSGTTLFECEKLNRSFIGVDINTEIINYVHSQMKNSDKDFFRLIECDTTNTENFEEKIKNALGELKQESVQFAIMHPPYMDIVKFTDKKEDLSQIKDLNTFVKTFNKAVGNTISFLDKNRYFAIVVGDIYKNREVIPLAFCILHNIKQNFKVKLKGIIVKNIEGNRGKLGLGGIWKYRALKSDYFIFKHEYILVFKKEF